MPRLHNRLVVLMLIVGALSACGGPASATVPTPSPAALPSAAPTTGSIVLPSVAPATPSATPAPTETPEPTATPVPPTATPEPIVGTLAMPRGSLSERPFAVMLDNHPNAYPQTGLNEAAVVFEALAEFGITRYMALYPPGISPELSEIGPVRSARSYFVEWAKGFRAVYVHAGGSPEGLLLAETSIELLNMDALRRNAGDYFRRSGAREAPHNLFTDTASMVAFSEAQGLEPVDLSEIGFLFKPEVSPADRPAAQSLSYFFIYSDAYVGWTYDPDSNEYRYFRQARPHVDARSGEQVRFKNVVVLEVPERPIPNDPKSRIEQQVIGEGAARVFRDGTVVEATWRKGAGYAQLQIIGPDGVEVAFNPGAIWIAAIPSLDNLTIEAQP